MAVFGKTQRNQNPFRHPEVILPSLGPRRVGRQGKSDAIRRAQWIGMIELIRHPSKGRCHTFWPKRQSYQRGNRHPSTPRDGRDEEGCCGIQIGHSSRRCMGRSCRDVSHADQPGHFVRRPLHSDRALASNLPAGEARPVIVDRHGRLAQPSADLRRRAQCV